MVVVELTKTPFKDYRLTELLECQRRPYRRPQEVGGGSGGSGGNIFVVAEGEAAADQQPGRIGRQELCDSQGRRQ